MVKEKSLLLIHRCLPCALTFLLRSLRWTDRRQEKGAFGTDVTFESELVLTANTFVLSEYLSNHNGTDANNSYVDRYECIDVGRSEHGCILLHLLGLLG